MKKILWLLLLCSCAHKPAATPVNAAAAADPYLWLEEVEGKQALEWVEKQNLESTTALAKNENFLKMQKDALKILEATDKIPGVGFNGKDLMNFWQDAVHVRGILRKTTLASFKTKNPKWTTVLDIDALAKKENENWIYKGGECLPPEENLCLITLSRGGKDASVIREYDIKNKKFVENGFNLPEAKSMVSWVDADHILVGTDFGPGTLTTSGYPRQVKLLARGQQLAAATLVFEGVPTDVWASPSLLHHNEKQLTVIFRGIDFFNSEEFVFDMQKKQKVAVPKPAGAELAGYFDGLLIYKLRQPWSFASQNYIPGAVVSIDSQAAGRQLKAEDVQLVYSPADNQAFAGLEILKTKLVVSVLEDVKSRLFTTSLKDGKWEALKTIDLPGNGNIRLAAATDNEDLFLFYYENFNQASTLNSYNFKKKELLKTLPERFNAKGVVVDQKFATSKDGTKIPYFLVHKKSTALDGNAPTLQEGYGGFEVSRTPFYNAIYGKLWIERGGVYVLANIRGGGEYGPKWHLAALKEKRQNAYDDFIAVSEDLIKNKITSPAKLAIRGGSNGGLLVGAVMVQRPDLYGAILCGVPLLDMLRYNQLLAGASWMGEYGDPNVPQYRAAIEKYSPYQNVFADKKYAPVLFFTSTKDDRVHPGHARKMAAKMKEQKHQVLYYENTEGGHAASANFKQQAMMSALQVQFLYETIAKK